ncbi:fructose-bisphosphatase class III [Lachnospiraceae bacterium KK002]|uniref:fructose-bisphosphatase class III n=1 Tax=Eubacterium sp. 14-2 TaxID=1235790 RepID=UPI000334B9CE|nr:fructose-bisphosphatase class III [Eubacterium sp. 14-2]EOT21723.1 fructose-1,6-bisphosphatase III [Eubacterium sp. 14-2]
METGEIRYLKGLAKQYPTIPAAATEIVNLQAILSLPKGTEHFITDIHGEYDQFQHVMKNGSGAIKRKIEEEFGNSLSVAEKKSIAILIYYPELKLKQVLKQEENLEDWYKVTLYRLIRICKGASSKYTRSKVRKALPKDFAYVIEELLTGRPDVTDQEAYYNEIINSVIRTGRASELVVAFCNLIRRLIVDHLHVVGDIYDRGPYPNLIMDTLMEHHSVDIQWGNHDVLWMGAAAGNPACIANVIRISAKYGNLNTLEDGYGINLIPLVRFALDKYAKDPCDVFHLDYREDEYDVKDVQLDEKMHKAIAIIQFKLEGQLMKKHPEFQMDHRLLLDKMDLEKGTVEVEGKTYPLKDTCFPTIDMKNPYELSPEEADVVDRLVTAFINCEKLQKHIRFLFTKGSLYKVYNGNLLYHGCVPFNEDGTFKKVRIYDGEYSGKALYDVLEHYARKGYYSIDKTEKQKGLDILWFIWQNANSPVFGKSKMTTFERYFIADKKTHKEPKNPYYRLLEQEEIVSKILHEFGLEDEDSHIINGHVPVETKRGESPVKCNGKLLIIDGGFSKAYQPKTGIAGYTLIYNSYGLLLAAHEPFESVEKAVQNGSDIHSHMMLVQHVNLRRTVADTDVGKEIKENIIELEKLLCAYREGTIVERQ